MELYMEHLPDGSYEVYYTNPALKIAWVTNTSPDTVDGAFEAIIGDTLEADDLSTEDTAL